MRGPLRGSLAVLVALPAIVALLGAAPAPSPSDAVTALWTGLPSSTNSCDDVYDYFPDGGLRILWCHTKGTLLRPGQLEQLAGVPIWASGPHGKGTGLVLTEHATFGRYDPAFVKRLPSFAIPGAKDRAVRAATQPTYDAVIRSRARIAWAVHDKLAADPACAKRERDAYAANMAAARPNESYYERFYYFLEPTFCVAETDADTPGGGAASDDGNVTKTIAAWWLRRQLDGTEAAWVDALRVLLETYDAKWLAAQTRAPKAPR